MKIAITGTSGIGKTTLAKELSKVLKIPMLDENYQGIIEIIDKINNAKKEHLGYLDNELAEAYIKWIKERGEVESNKGSFVSDRCSFDLLSDFLSTNAALSKPQLTKDLILECNKQSANYDLIVVLPLNLWSINLGANEHGMMRQNNFSLKIKDQSIHIGLLEQFCHSTRIYINPNCSTTAQRIEYIQNVLKQIEQIKRK